MELIRGLHNLRARHRGCVATIGTFDGVHLGHQDILGRVCGHARRLGLPSALVTFEPMPREFLDPVNAPPRLTRLRDKFGVLAAQGLERLLVLRFDTQLQTMSGERFVADLLIERLDARQVVIGHDFRFGAGGATTGATLERAGSVQGFAVEVVAPVTLLGRRYHATGRVVRGEQLGRKLPYATANLKLRHSFPLWGILAVQAAREDGPLLPGVASVGTRPTVNGKEPVLEVHLFDFADEFYGEHLRVEFVAKLREERKFASLEAMVAQMHEDARQARAILANAA